MLDWILNWNNVKEIVHDKILFIWINVFTVKVWNSEELDGFLSRLGISSTGNCNNLVRVTLKVFN